MHTVNAVNDLMYTYRWGSYSILINRNVDYSYRLHNDYYTYAMILYKILDAYGYS